MHALVILKKNNTNPNTLCMTKDMNRDPPLSFPYLLLFAHFVFSLPYESTPPQWAAVNAEMKLPSGENTELNPFPFNPFPASRMLYEVCGKACCHRMLNANFLRKFQLLVQSGAKLSSKDEHFWPLQHLF